MSILKRSELRGILVMAMIIVIIAGLLAVANGKLETWFGITIGGGARLYDKIVYVSGSELHVINPDGSGAKQLTAGGLVVGSPCVSPNGARVVFVGRTGRSSQIYMVRCGGGEAVTLTSVTGGKRLPQYSPDGQQLAFISGGTVYVGNQDADDLRPVLPTSQQTQETMMRRDPLPAYDDYAWTADGKGMGGVMQNAPQGDALVLLAKLGGEAKNFAMPGARVSIDGISWSKEGRLLAATAKIGAQNVALVVNVAEKNAVGLAGSPKDEYGSIALSPDGSKAAFAVRSKGGNGLLLKDTSTGQGGMLAAGDFDSLSFSPAGDRILAVKIGDGARDVVIIDAESGQVTQLTNDGKSFDPVWSPAKPE